MTRYAAPVATIVGVLTYALAEGKLAECGRVVFMAGLVVTLWALTSGQHGRTLQ